MPSRISELYNKYSQAFRAGGRTNLLKYITEEETAMFPTSFAATNPSFWKITALYLLFQVNKEFIMALFNNTIPKHLDTDNEIMFRLRVLKRSDRTPRPVIYSITLLHSSMRNPLVGEIRNLIIDARRYLSGDVTFQHRIDNFLGREEKMWLDEHSRAPKAPKYDRPYLTSWINSLEQRLNLDNQGAGEEIKPGLWEIGYAGVPNDRLDQHYSCGPSANKILSFSYRLLSNRLNEFEMRYLPVFYLINEEQGRVGEMLASMMFASYLPFGNMNSTHAGGSCPWPSEADSPKLLELWIHNYHDEENPEILLEEEKQLLRGMNCASRASNIRDILNTRVRLT